MVYSLGNLNWEIYQSITDRYVTNEENSYDILKKDIKKHIKMFCII